MEISHTLYPLSRSYIHRGKGKDLGGKKSPPTSRPKGWGERALSFSQGLRNSGSHQRPLQESWVWTTAENRRVQKTKDYLLQNSPYLQVNPMVPRTRSWWENFIHAYLQFERPEICMSPGQIFGTTLWVSNDIWHWCFLSILENENWGDELTCLGVGGMSENGSTTSKSGASLPGC